MNREPYASDSDSDTCAHWAGLMGPGMVEVTTCLCGVRYVDVEADIPKSGQMNRLPCFKKNGLPCPSQHFRTAEEIVELRTERKASITRYFTKINDDICPQCDRPITLKRQVGRCVYASPCGHRLYQGWLTPEAEEQAEQQGLWT